MRWSYSMLSKYERCPAQYRFKYIEGLEEKKSEQMQRGIDIHNDADMYLSGKIKKLPPSLKRFSSEFKLLKANDVKPEMPWYFNNKWEYVPEDEKGRAWGVAKIDAHWLEEFDGKNLLVVEDHKTGNIHDYSDQGKLYLTVGMSIYKNINYGTFRFWFLDVGVVMPERPTIYPARRLDALQKEYTHRVSVMFNDKKLNPTPGAKICRWCNFNKSKGGPCKYG